MLQYNTCTWVLDIYGLVACADDGLAVKLESLQWTLSAKAHSRRIETWHIDCDTFVFPTNEIFQQ